MTVEELYRRLGQEVAAGRGGAEIDVTVSPTHGLSCGNDDRHFPLDDVFLVNSTCFLTVSDNEWTPAT